MLVIRDYTKKLSQYRKRLWSCQETGKAGLTYEEALLSEARAKGDIHEVYFCIMAVPGLANAPMTTWALDVSHFCSLIDTPLRYQAV